MIFIIYSVALVANLICSYVNLVRYKGNGRHKYVGWFNVFASGFMASAIFHAAVVS
jgi:hypothetical protein